MSPQPTVSSYAVLGLLALRPWTGYELTRQATRSLRFAWPKSERLLYSEPKKLVELGWAATHRETVDGRSREMEDSVVAINSTYLEGGHPFPDRTHLSVLFATFQVEVFRVMQRRADFASDEIDTWPDIKGVGRTDRVDELIVAMRDRHSLLADKPPRDPEVPRSP